MMENKIDRETAEREFDRFMDAMDLDTDSSAWDEDDRKSFDQQKDRIVRAIQNGSLVVNDDGEPVYTTGAETLTFHEPKGSALMAMDRRKKGEDVGKFYATMADITGTNAKTFALMKNRDLKVCMAITALFLA